ncbi:hypothetical protein ACS0TY_019078 [Phlomoides rotata]
MVKEDGTDKESKFNKDFLNLKGKDGFKIPLNNFREEGHLTIQMQENMRTSLTLILKRRCNFHRGSIRVQSFPIMRVNRQMRMR